MKVVFKRDPQAKDIGVAGSYVLDAKSRKVLGYFRFERIHDADGVDSGGEFWDYEANAMFDLSSNCYASEAKQEVREILAMNSEDRKSQLPYSIAN